MKKKNLHRIQIPLALTTIILASYALMLPSLGYSFDDWNFIYYATRGLDGLMEVFHYDGHPQAVWSYFIGFKLFGYAPLTWHLVSLFWRWCAVISFWALLDTLWQENQRENFLAAALFAIYPTYTLQPYSVTFYEIWIAFTLLFLSFLFTLKAIRQPEKKKLYVTLSILFRIAAIFTKEYAWFVELMRPTLIWFALPEGGERKKKASATLKIWLPHFAIFTLMVLWRGFFYTPTRKFFQVDGSLLRSPIETLLRWATDILPDITSVLITSWYRIFDAEFLYFIRPFNIALFAAGILIAGALFFFLKGTIQDETNRISQRWASHAFIVGLPSLIFGIAPFYIAHYAIHTTEFPFNARFAIGMLPGAALIGAALLESLLTEPNRKIIVIAVLLGITITWHIRYTNDYRKVWAYQKNILEQVTWRVPGIQPGTALFIHATSVPTLVSTSPANLALEGDFPTARAINAFYQVDPQGKERQLAYWVYSSLAHLSSLPEHLALHEEHATSYFDGDTGNALLFLYAPDDGQCLHLIQAGDEAYRKYPDEIKALAPYASTQNLLTEPAMQENIRAQILGDKENTWCYFYEKADLARQKGDWAEITALWQAAEENALHPKHGTEYIPFIEAFAHQNQWQQAVEFTKKATKISNAMDSLLCPLWENIANSTQNTSEEKQAVTQAKALLQCSQ